MAARTRARGCYDASKPKHLTAIDGFIKDFTGPRTLHTLDLFCGKGNFAAESTKMGLSTAAVDVLRDPANHDLTTEAGFFYVLDVVLRLAPGRVERNSFVV